MKTLGKILPALVVLLSCNQMIQHPPQKLSIGTVEAKMNGRKWTNIFKNAYQIVRGGRHTAVPCVKSSLYINFELYSPEGFLRQQLLFSKIPKQSGSYAIVGKSPPNCSERDSVYCDLYTFIDDGCIAENAYEVVAEYPNFLRIDQYDEGTSEIEGRFQMTLVKTNQLSITNLPDTLRFTQGHFFTKVIIGRYIQ